MQSLNRSSERPVHVFLAVFIAALLPACRTLENEAPVVPGAIDPTTFALMDADGDGKVSPAEMATYKHEEGLAEVDLDNDKRISPAEWKSARPSAPPNEDAFTKLDLNRDGFLAKDEAVTYITAQGVFRDAFKKMDANADGFLVREEYSAGDATSLDVTFFSAGTPDAPTGTVQ